MLFNWEQALKVLLKLYIDPVVPVAGKYTFCKLKQVEKQLLIFIEPTTVGILVNFTHSSCRQLLKVAEKVLTVLIEGNVIDLRLAQVKKQEEKLKRNSLEPLNFTSYFFDKT